MKDLVFLPDRDGRDELSDQPGFVRLYADASSLSALAERLAAPERASAEADAVPWRAVLALALLADVWADCDAKLSVLTVDGTASPFAAWVLAARPAAERNQPVQLVLLERAGERRLLGVADAACGLRLPVSRLNLTGAVPACIEWIDNENGTLSDPVPFLSERDRVILLRRMERMELTAPEALDFMEALRQADAAEVEAVRQEEEAALERLAVRMEAIHGLLGFAAFSVEKKRYAAAGSNPLVACFADEDAACFADLGENCVYMWNGVPFACISSELGLTGTAHPEMDATLQAITAELTMMSVNSVSWNHRTSAEMRRWLDDHEKDAVLLPQAKKRIEASCALMHENGRQVQSAVTLTWPWTGTPMAVRALISEALGGEWLEGAMAPFADRLTKLTGHVLGDTVLQACCACADGVLLPPLSEAMAACVASAEEGGGLAVDTIRFQPQEDGGITASFLMRGKGEMLFSRSYAADEMAVLEEQESPCVAVWPCLPMAHWRAYQVFARGGVEVRTLNGGAWQRAALLENTDVQAVWRCCKTAQYPACLSLMRDGLCLGVLPNLLPAFRVEAEQDMTAAIDLGSSQTTVAFAVNGKAKTIEGQELTRLLVMPQEMQEDDLLQSLMPASAVPTAVTVTGPGEILFTDGHICRRNELSDLVSQDADTLRTHLKWRADAESVRARKLLLHQVMLQSALTASMEGARSIAWRVNIADEMADDGRDEILATMNENAALVAEESGLPLAEQAVTWAEESAALCTQLRNDGSGGGSYVALDLGGGSTKMHLWVQGQPRPVAGAVLLEGVQEILLAALCAQPRRLIDDFADCGDEQLLQAVLALADQMNPDLASPRQKDKLGLMLDSMLDTLRPNIVSHLSSRFAAQNPTYTQAVLLETEAAILFIAGLMLAQAGNDVMLSHRLPEDMTVCMTGRGAWLLDTLTPAMRNSLQHLTHVPMRLDHPVRFVTLRSAARPAQSVAMGLALTRDVQRLSEPPMVYTRESFSGLMQRLMLQLCTAFPMHMWLLHEGLFDWQGGLTPAGDDAIRQVASRCYGDGEDIPAAVMSFVRELREVAIGRYAMSSPDA